MTTIGHRYFFGNRVILIQSHDGKHGRQPETIDLIFQDQDKMASILGGTKTWDASECLKFLQPFMAWDHKAIGELWFQTQPAKHYLFFGVSHGQLHRFKRRIKNDTKHRRLWLLLPADPDGCQFGTRNISIRAQNHISSEPRWMVSIDHTQAGNTNRDSPDHEPGEPLGQQNLQCRHFNKAVGLASANFHEGPGPTHLLWISSTHQRGTDLSIRLSVSSMKFNRLNCNEFYQPSLPPNCSVTSPICKDIQRSSGFFLIHYADTCLTWTIIIPNFCFLVIHTGLLLLVMPPNETFGYERFYPIVWWSPIFFRGNG